MITFSTEHLPGQSRARTYCSRRNQSGNVTDSFRWLKLSKAPSRASFWQQPIPTVRQANVTSGAAPDEAPGWTACKWMLWLLQLKETADVCVGKFRLPWISGIQGDVYVGRCTQYNTPVLWFWLKFVVFVACLLSVDEHSPWLAHKLCGLLVVVVVVV